MGFNFSECETEVNLVLIQTGLLPFPNVNFSLKKIQVSIIIRKTLFPHVQVTIGEKIVEALSSKGALSNNKKVGLFVVLNG